MAEKQDIGLNELNEALSLLNEGDFLFHLNTVVREHGWVLVAEKSDMARESLYKTLDPQGKPRFSSILKILNSMGFKLQVVDTDKIGKKSPSIRFNSLLYLYPNIASEWHPIKNGKLKPNDVTPFTRKKVWWECSKKHVWEFAVNQRAQGEGCPFCAAKKLLERVGE